MAGTWGGGGGSLGRRLAGCGGGLGVGWWLDEGWGGVEWGVSWGGGA